MIARVSLLLLSIDLFQHHKYIQAQHCQQVSEIDSLHPRDFTVDIKTYLETAPEIKRDVRNQAWMCYGWCHLTNDSRAAVYRCLAIIVFVLEGAVYAWTVGFPGGVNKPQSAGSTSDPGWLSCCWGWRAGVVATGQGGHVRLLRVRHPDW